MTTSQPAPRISYEFFPPQPLDASFKLFVAVQALAPMGPEFVSVTYGAGGTTRKLTHDAVTTLRRSYGLNVAAHLTCVEATRAETLEIAEGHHQAGVRQIVALRGDAPNGMSRFQPHKDGFASSVDPPTVRSQASDPQRGRRWLDHLAWLNPPCGAGYLQRLLRERHGDAVG